MKIKFTFVLSVLVILLINSSCKTSTTLTQKTTFNAVPEREHTVQSLLWQQNAAEYKALTHQAYNLAKFELDKLTQRHYKRPIAIVTDIDETVLDNSPYNARMVRNNSHYTKETWIAWGKEEKAKAIPGALAFFKYAESKGVTIFYLSNRYNIQKAETMNNLIKFGFPNVDSKHVLLRTTTSTKKPRRDMISKTHQIVMLLGDNLSDFNEEFDKKTTKERNDLVEKMKTKFGTKLIIFPNPMYGDWEKAIYNGTYKWSEKQKDSIRKQKMTSN